VHVAELDGVVAGFIFTIMDERRKTCEIGLNAVDPALQGRGIGKAMYQYALDNLKERGAEIACVGTGGDAAHEAARRAYQAAGFDRALPGLHLFKVL
jgi:GNAT superfamily N-acetyltransferase